MMVAHSARTSRSETLRLPPELSGTVPREVRLTGAGIAVAVVAIALAIAALVSAILMSVAYARTEEQRRLREHEGVAVQARVVQVVLRRGEHPRRIVTYSFEVDGRSYTGSTRLRERDRRAVTKGGPIAIGYVRSRPEKNWVTGYTPNGFPLWAIPLVSVSLLAGAAAIAWGLRRQWVLLSEGRAAEARITGYKKVHTDKHKAYRVSCEFEDLSGARHTARYDVGKTPPSIGTTAPIVYHRDKPQWSATFPLQLVRPRSSGSRSR